MPPKQRNNSNNKKKSKKGGAAAAAAATASLPTTSNKAIDKWIKGDNVTAKGLSKKLPGLAERIRDGNIDTKDVPKMVENAQKNRLLSELEKAMGKVGVGLNDRKVMRVDSLQLLTGGEQLLCDLCKVACGNNENLIHAFAKDFFRTKNWGSVEREIQNILDNGSRTDIDWDSDIMKKIESGNVGNLTAEEMTSLKSMALKLDLDAIKPIDYALLDDVQQSFDRTCDKWKPEIERLVKKPLREFCSAYKVSRIAFINKCAYLMERSKNYSLESLAEDYAFTQTFEKQQDKKVEAAARGVKAGWDTIRQQCWECGKVDPNVLKCSLCKAARYCSKDCQRQSWRTGHKHACSTLQVTYEHFSNNYDRVNKALTLQEEKHECPMYHGCSLQPAGAKDYMMVSLMLLKQSFPIQPCPCDSPTIDHMYKSLADIVSGKHHWMFTDTFSGTLQEYLDTTVIERASAEEAKYLIYGLLFLGVDLATAKPAHYLDETVYRMREMLRSFLKSGELMPASRFIGIYYRFGLAQRQGYEDPLTRTANLAKCFYMMMNCHHKTVNVDQDKFAEIMKKFPSQK